MWWSCVPCSRLGYLKVHSYSYQASLGHTQRSCLSPHISAFLSFLSPLDENQLVAWERSLNFSPVFPAWEGKAEGEGSVFFSQENVGVHSVILVLVQLTVKHNAGCGYTLRFLSRKLHCVRIIIASPFPCFKMTSCSQQDREVLSRISQF